MKCVVGDSPKNMIRFGRGKVYVWSKDYSLWEFNPSKAQEAVDHFSYADYIFTMNPFIVDCFKAEDVIVVCDDKFSSLIKHPEWSDFDGVLSTGKFWSNVGEEWVKYV